MVDLLKKNVNSTQLKKTFLSEIEEAFVSCFREVYDARLHQGPASSTEASQQVRLAFRPPYKSESPPFEEREPAIEVDYADGSAGQRGGRGAEVLCTLEDVCNISVNEGDNGCGLELARRNGVPIHIWMPTGMEGRDFVSHVAGYYRLCEKWTFPLSTHLRYPASLDFCMANNVHGPVTNVFVEDKFKYKSRQT